MVKTYLNVTKAFYAAATAFALTILFPRTIRAAIRKNQFNFLWHTTPASILVDVFILTLIMILLIILSKKTKSLAKANKELEVSNRLRKTFFDANTSLMYLKDENLKYVLVNEMLRQFLGRPHEEIIGKDDFDLLAPGFAKMCTDTDLKALRQNRLITTVTCWDNRFYRTTKFPARMPKDRIGVGGYMSDITEEYKQQKARERMLKRNQLLLKVLIHNFDSKQEQLDYALHALLDLSESQYGYIYFYDEETQRFVLNTWSQGVMKECSVPGTPKEYELANTGIWGEVVRQRKPIIVNDFPKPNPLKKGFPKGHVQLQKFMSAPVIFDNKIVAVVGLGNKKTDYDQTDVDEVTMLMSGVWSAVLRKESRDTLLYERNKYYRTLLAIGDGVIVIGCNKRIKFMNSVAEKLTGWTAEEALNQDFQSVIPLIYEKGCPSLNETIGKVCKTGESQEPEHHAVLFSEKGARHYIELSAMPVSDEEGVLADIVLVLRDVTESKHQAERIEYVSFHDSLTGLYNRLFFEKQLRRMDTEDNLPISILLGDVDGLKLTNDIFGHAYGDLLLKKVAKALRKVCRQEDIIARWGGDEFALVLSKTSPVQAREIVRKIKIEVARHEVRGVRCALSMGFDTKTSPSVDITRILSNAETKMYSAKTLGRSSVQRRELDEIVNAWYANSEEERRHAERVGEMCGEFGEVLGLAKSDIKGLTRAAHLHDIGKVVLEPELLKSERKLSPTEEKELMQHPLVGYRILNYFDQTLALAETVLAHHENWDGTGYPKGLKGEEIPLPARIIAVVGTYDRLVHKPDGPNHQNKKAALNQIRSRSGTEFDPNIVRRFVEWIKDK